MRLSQALSQVNFGCTKYMNKQRWSTGLSRARKVGELETYYDELKIRRPR